MSTDKKPEDQITEAGAVELDESQLDQASGGIIAIAPVSTPEAKFDPVGVKDTIHHTVEERAHFQALLDLGLTDAYRMFEQPEKSYSWWDYRMLGFQKNRGLRIDHILVSEALRGTVTACHIDRLPRKNQQPSDHAPVVVTLG